MELQKLRENREVVRDSSLTVIRCFREGRGAHLEVPAGERFLHLKQSQKLPLQADGARDELGLFRSVEPVDLLQLGVQPVEEDPVLLAVTSLVVQLGLVQHAGDIVVAPIYRVLVQLVQINAYKLIKSRLLVRTLRQEFLKE
jgi:hypothetical protein